MALQYAGVVCEKREVKLTDKPQAMIELSAKATVPVLQIGVAYTIDESVDIILWALAQSDPNNWLAPGIESELVQRNDSYFKLHLDRYKYYDRYPQHSQQHYLEKALVYLCELEALLGVQRPFFHGERLTWVDVAIFPFIRQFAMVDRAAFDLLPLPKLQIWLRFFLASSLFNDVMQKVPTWQSAEGDSSRPAS